jgi:hypothetical protein
MLDLLERYGWKIKTSPSSVVGYRRDIAFGTGCTVRWSNPGGGEIFRTVHTGSGAHPVSCTMGAGSFPGVKRPGRGVDHPPSSRADVKERVDLYLHSTSRRSWPVIGWTMGWKLHVHRHLLLDTSTKLGRNSSDVNAYSPFVPFIQFLRRSHDGGLRNVTGLELFC